MDITSPGSVHNYMVSVMRLGAGEYGYRKFSAAWDSVPDSDKDSTRAGQFADFAALSWLLMGESFNDDEFHKWMTRSMCIGQHSISVSIVIFESFLEALPGQVFIEDHEKLAKQEYVIDRIYRHLGFESGYKMIRNRIIFCDGEQISIQASADHNSSPSADFGPYVSVEVGFPTFIDPRLFPYACDKDDPLETTYEFVPSNLMVEVIKEHGGVLQGDIPFFKQTGDGTSW